MTTKQIDYLIELSQTLNFNQAAKNLYISQPTLTYQINAIEEEIGFKIFKRTKKSVSLTPAGEQFILSLRSIKTIFSNAVEQGQNFSNLYTEDITIGIPTRSCLHFLPEAIEIFAKSYPHTNVTPIFIPFHNADAFLRREVDIVFLLDEDVNRIPNIDKHQLFESGLYLITRKDHRLSNKQLVKEEDLLGETLMVGGDSPVVLREVQQNLMNKGINYFNSMNHDMTLINVAAKKGICIAPGFLNDHNNEFSWIPYDNQNGIQCNLYTHSDDTRESVHDLIKIIKRIYDKNSDLKL